MAEGIHGRFRRDLDAKALARGHVDDGKLHAIDLGVPEEEHLVGSSQPPR
jgi:hypothetical protein